MSVDPATISILGIKPIRWAIENVADRQVVTVKVDGNLKKEFDAIAITGEDVIRVIKKK